MKATIESRPPDVAWYRFVVINPSLSAWVLQMPNGPWGFVPRIPPGTLRLPSIVFNSMREKQLKNPFLWCVIPRLNSTAAGLRGKVLPSISIVLPMRAASANSFVILAIVALGTVVIASTFPSG